MDVSPARHHRRPDLPMSGSCTHLYIYAFACISPMSATLVNSALCRSWGALEAESERVPNCFNWLSLVAISAGSGRSSPALRSWPIWRCALVHGTATGCVTRYRSRYARAVSSALCRRVTPYPNRESTATWPSQPGEVRLTRRGRDGIWVSCWRVKTWLNSARL